jgi:hypothetical protein
LRRKIIQYWHQDRTRFKRRFGDKTGELMAKQLPIEHAIEVIKRDGMKCHLCDNRVKLIFKARDSKQMTLDRIDNKLGHVVGNILISCYSCNILRSNVYTSEQFKEHFC